ncbi:hypothetical protein C1646_678186 [Rhizophagus diaphanus]|nr:hypothetical protein C1646_678186 [Rhizophagus diaphanus] [Rhizophagus sp. MUCL 43196]
MTKNLTFSQTYQPQVANRFQRGYRYSRKIGSSVNTESQRKMIPKLNTKSHKKTVLTWIPNPIGNGFNLDIESHRLVSKKNLKLLKKMENSSNLDTESHKLASGNYIVRKVAQVYTS